MRLYDLPVLSRTILLCVVFLILWFTMMFLAETVYQRMFRGFSVIFILIGAVNYIFFQLCLDEIYGMQLWGIIVYILGMILFNYFIIYKGVMYRHGNFTIISVKQGLDAMEEGICFYTENGLPQFVNRTMNNMSITLTGETINDASAFWNRLRNGNISQDCGIIYNSDDMVITKTSEGRVAAFSNRSMDIGGELKEMMMVDITSEYRTFEELMEKNEALELAQERLKEYNRNVTAATIEKELLNAKVHIHDELGEILLAAKRYLRTGEGSRDTITELWKRNLSLLKVEKKAVEGDEYDQIYRAASDIGMKIFVKGDLPEDRNTKTVTASALHECLTNTFRHAGGDTVFVNVSNSDAGLSLVFTNNGEPPIGPVEERGGLKHLRQKARDAGFKMEIETEGGFRLALTRQGE